MIYDYVNDKGNCDIFRDWCVPRISTVGSGVSGPGAFFPRVLQQQYLLHQLEHQELRRIVEYFVRELRSGFGEKV